ncbi:N5-carboxyaminoimidazole ribonucleotide synthase [Anaplasma phagocytophilum]|uniref:N5-carboxyaminoimidazole ribonucleotide synthase n=2 Tax=Anaplasma phagocytophilum TaxID=948 RepID=A0AA45UTE9_ANAPH|nr:5-(carboxyamino)imidazole ribonucleotide synthase [Anaplasma phagocytophilum]SBO14544.1 N5-carboxyaminoimidazole ribonucleotide synthase [Anaplasma phagocytophilum]
MRTSVSHSMLSATRVGIIGGGQLGKMLSLSASKLGYQTSIFAESAIDPAVFVTNSSVIGSFSDTEKLRTFASMVDVAVIEFENIPVSAVHTLQETIPVYPGVKALHVAQNRIREKTHIQSLGIAVADFAVIHSHTDLHKAVHDVGVPSVLKTAESGYDGKGQYVLRSIEDIASLVHLPLEQGYILERLIEIEKEISIIIAVDRNASHTFFPVAKNTHVDGVLSESIVPAGISIDLQKQAQEIAYAIATSLEMVGILAVEFFISKSGKLLVNEIAPRPHNSGHWSQDACNVSQFEQLIRIACGLPMRAVHLLTPCVMRNVFGDNIIDEEIHQDHRNSISLYGKQPRAKRKMGHINSLLY